jgi:hypothetical protein
MKIGFTGTRRGMTDAQKESVKMLLCALTPEKFSHGHCVGADEEASIIASKIHGIEIWSWPPENQKAIATFAFWHVIRTPLPYMKRNQKIVDTSDTLIATPAALEKDAPRSGTWATVRMARKAGHLRFIIWRDGSIKVEA